MGADLAALHAAIIADPADDFPRLLYADLLDERGGPGDAERAEWVRGKRPEMDHRGYCYLDFAVDFGLAVLEYPLDMPRPAKITNVFFRRGFMAEVECTTEEWRRHGPRLVREHPIARVRLTDREPRRRAALSARDPHGGVFLWDPQVLCDCQEHRKCVIPDWLWRCAQREALRLAFFWHESPEAAHTALSGLCLAWARQASNEFRMDPFARKVVESFPSR